MACKPPRYLATPHKLILSRTEVSYIPNRKSPPLRVRFPTHHRARLAHQKVQIAAGVGPLHVLDIHLGVVIHCTVMNQAKKKCELPQSTVHAKGKSQSLFHLSHSR